MGKRRIMALLACALLLTMFVACGGSSEPVSSMNEQVTNSAENAEPGASAGVDSGAADANAETAAGNEGVGAENSENHDDAEDDIWDSSASIQIHFNGNSITVDGEGATVDGSQVTITSAGTYSVSGSLAGGQIVVNTEDEGIVRLVLNGVDIRNSTSAPIYVQRAEEVLIVLADNTENHVSDGESYLFEDAEEDEPNAAIFSSGDLTIYGNGSLIVDANYQDGIASKDGLIIKSGTITVRAVDDGIRGKDYLIVKDGNITVDAQGDGLKSDNEEDATKGFVSIEEGIIQITSGGDAIHAQTDVLITAGEITLSSGGGSGSRFDVDASAKGIKALVSINIEGGAFTIDAADDAIHSNGGLTINGGTFVIASGDDAMHADSTLEVNDGDIRITDSYEGLESAVITINDGQFHVISSDDGLNVAGGMDGSGMNQGPAPGGGPGRGGGPGQDVFTYSGDNYLYINGGYVVIDAAGDGLDVNGAIEMTDGVVIVNGPTERMNGALDYDASFKITGGFLVAAGSAGMAQAPSESSTQASVLLNFDSTLRAGTLVHIQSAEGSEILAFSPTKDFQSIAFSSSALVSGSTYEVTTGGSATGTVQDGLYRDATVAAGDPYTSFTVSGMVTRVGGFFR
jgi:hypothetical protein